MFVHNRFYHLGIIIFSILLHKTLVLIFHVRFTGVKQSLLKNKHGVREHSLRTISITFNYLNVI